MKSSLPWLLAAALYVALLLPLLLTPISRLHAHPRAYLREFHDTPIRVLVRDVAVNIVIFVPLGWLLTQATTRTPLSAAWTIGVAVGITAVLSLSVETIQYFIATRYSSILDVLANTAGAALGAVAVRRRRRNP